MGHIHTFEGNYSQSDFQNIFLQKWPHIGNKTPFLCQRQSLRSCHGVACTLLATGEEYFLLGRKLECTASEWVIKFNSLFWTSGHQGLSSTYKPWKYYMTDIFLQILCNANHFSMFVGNDYLLWFNYTDFPFLTNRSIISLCYRKKWVEHKSEGHAARSRWGKNGPHSRQYEN